MELSEGIRKIGFRRWYERQLIESHLFLISGFLCLIMVLACMEEFNLRTPAWETLVRFAAVIAGVALCVWTWRRYLTMLGIAEHVAEHSVCGKCDVYRGLELSGTAAADAPGHHADEADGVIAPVGVRCRKCGHEWTIE